MGMFDESWCASCGQGMHYTPDDTAMCGNCAIEMGTEFAETVIRFIEDKYNEHEQALSDIHAKYEGGDMFDNDDSSMIDYHEGAVEALGVVLHKVKDLYQNG